MTCRDQTVFSPFEARISCVFLIFLLTTVLKLICVQIWLILTLWILVSVTLKKTLISFFWRYSVYLWVWGVEWGYEVLYIMKDHSFRASMVFLLCVVVVMHVFWSVLYFFLSDFIFYFFVFVFLRWIWVSESVISFEVIALLKFCFLCFVFEHIYWIKNKSIVPLTLTLIIPINHTH